MSSSNHAAAAAGSLLALVLGAPTHAAVDLANLQVLPQRGQSAEQTRRDRYECHNWAVEQTGVAPPAAPTRDEAKATDRERRAERWGRVLAGAAIGAGVGGLIDAADEHHHYRGHDADGALAGAAVGAAIGAATGRKRERDAEVDPETNEYLRALGACLEGRGYTVASPSAETSAALTRSSSSASASAASIVG